MVDQFTTARVSKLLADFKQRQGRDITMAELLTQGFTQSSVDDMVRAGLLTKYQVVAKGGRTENRFKLAVDWRTLRP